MPWPKSSVPKFGNWDKSEDLSYSIIFDKVRAEKEKFLHISDSDFSSEQSFYKNDNVEAGEKTLFPDKSGAYLERFLPTSQQDKSFTHMHQNVLQDSEVPAGRDASHVPYERSPGLRTRISGPSRVKSPPGCRISQEQHSSIDVEPESWNRSDAPVYNTSFPLGGPSRQPLQVGATKETTFFNERQHVDQANRGLPGRLHAKSTNTPRRATYAEPPPIAKIRSSQGALEISRIAEMQRKHAVPKFGDWDSGDGFTAAFNKARNEKSSKYALNLRAKAVSALRPDEDLYKSSETSESFADGKKQRGWFPSICCSKPSTHSADS